MSDGDKARPIHSIRARIGEWRPEAFSRDELYADCETLLDAYDVVAKERDDMNKNCISLSLHDSRMWFVERERDELKQWKRDVELEIEAISEWRIKHDALQARLDLAVKALETIEKYTHEIKDHLAWEGKKIVSTPEASVARDALAEIKGDN